MAVAYEPQPGADDDGDQQRREEKLLLMLKAEEEGALGYAQTEIAEQQMEALRRYFGEPYGDEEDGRSQVVTRELFETIEWTRPDLMRVFSSGGNVIELIESTPEDGEYAKDAAKYLQWIFWEDNDGFTNLDDFAFDGLLHRRGYLACYWRDKEYRAPQKLTGLNMEQVVELTADKNIEIVGYDFDDESEAGGIELVVRRVKSPARVVIESVAPEDMRLNGRAVTFEQARYVGRVHRKLRGEIAQEWPDKAEEIKEYSRGRVSAMGSRRGEDVRQERFQDDDTDWKDATDEASEEMEVLEEYLRADINEDDYPELIRSYRLGDLILEMEEVEEGPFGSWAPVRVPHRFMGLGQHDQVADLQRQSTVITRAGLDALYQSVVNREAYNKHTVDLPSLLATYSGSKVAVDGDPAGAIMPLTGGLDTAQNAWQALEIINQRMEDRTGATRQTRGLDGDQLTKEHSGVALRQLQVNADARKEMMARNMANGLGEFFSKLYRLVCRNQNEGRQLKIGGQWCKFDPRTWNSELRVKIQPGGMNREHSLVGLQMIGAEQEKVVTLLGPSNPNVTPQKRYAYQAELCKQAGYSSAEAFFAEIPPDWQPEPEADPEAQKAQAEMQKLQMQGQMEAAKLQQQDAHIRLQAEKDIEVARQQQQDEMMRAQLQRQADAEKAALEQGKLALERERLQFEREKATAEIELQKMKLELEGAKVDLQAREGETARQHDLAKMDKDYKIKRKLTMKPEAADEADAAESGKPSTGEALLALAEELKKPRKIKRGKDGKVSEF